MHVVIENFTCLSYWMLSLKLKVEYYILERKHFQLIIVSSRHRSKIGGGCMWGAHPVLHIHANLHAHPRRRQFSVVIIKILI